MRVEADRLARSFENDARLASAASRRSRQPRQLKRQAASSNLQDVELRALERDAKSQRDLLKSYLAKYREATARDNLGAASPMPRESRGVLSNTPSWPKKLPTVLVAAFGMFILATGFLLTGQLMSGGAGASVVSTETVEASSSEPRVADVTAAGSPAVAGGPLAAPDVVAKTATSPATAAAAPSDGPGRARKSAPPVARPSVGMISKRTGVPIDAVEGLAVALSGAASAGRRVAMVGARRNMGTTLAASGARAGAAGTHHHGRSRIEIAEPVGDRERCEHTQGSANWSRAQSHSARLSPVTAIRTCT